MLKIHQMRLFASLSGFAAIFFTLGANGAENLSPFGLDPSQVLECTSFQTGSPWTPQGNLRSDVAIVYGIDTNLPARIKISRNHGIACSS
jgi:hypothetical protein